MVTLWPRFWSPTAASTTSRSAPPIPRSGWKNTMLCFVMASRKVMEGNSIRLLSSLDTFSKSHMVAASMQKKLRRLPAGIPTNNSSMT